MNSTGIHFFKFLAAQKYKLKQRHLGKHFRERGFQRHYRGFEKVSGSFREVTGGNLKLQGCNRGFAWILKEFQRIFEGISVVGGAGVKNVTRGFRDVSWDCVAFKEGYNGLFIIHVAIFFNCI